MISENIKKMFLFIDFLYDNIENFKQYDSIVNETVELSREYQKLEPKKYSDHDKKSKEIKVLHEANTVKINQSIRQPITDKLIELGLKKDNDCINLFTDIDALKINYEVIDERQVKVKHNKWNTVMLEIKDKWLFYTANEFSFFCEFDSAVNHLFSFFSEPKQQPEPVEPLPPLPYVKQKDIEETPKTFDELFYNAKLIVPCIQVLYNVQPPILTNQNEYNLGSKSKGSITAWITALKYKGFIKKNLSDSVIAPLLNAKIEGLNLGKDGRTLRNTETTAYKKYYTSILNLLPELPLSTKGKNW